MKRFLIALALAGTLVGMPLVTQAQHAHTKQARCYISRLEINEYKSYAAYILANYQTLDPEDVGPNALTREIKRENYFGRLECMHLKIKQLLDNEAAYQWYLAVVAAVLD